MSICRVPVRHLSRDKRTGSSKEDHVRVIAKLPPSIIAHRNDLGDNSPETAENAVYIAVVHADDTVRFATSAPTRSELTKRLAE